MTVAFARVALYLVRHAKAGKRSRFDGDDRQRPLDDAGRAQADTLGTRLATLPVPALYSSPFLRCVQTLEPLGVMLGLSVAVDDRLAEGADARSCIEWLLELPEHTVLCSHGDLIPDVVDRLVRRGMTIGGEPDTRKASTWVLERGEDSFVSGTVWPPPASSA